MGSTKSGAAKRVEKRQFLALQSDPDNDKMSDDLSEMAL